MSRVLSLRCGRFLPTRPKLQNLGLFWAHILNPTLAHETRKKRGEKILGVWHRR